MHYFIWKLELISNILWMIVGNVSNNFPIGNMEKTGLYVHVFDSLVDYDSIDVDNILHIYKYLMKKHVINNIFIY